MMEVYVVSANNYEIIVTKVLINDDLCVWKWLPKDTEPNDTVAITICRRECHGVYTKPV